MPGFFIKNNKYLFEKIMKIIFCIFCFLFGNNCKCQIFHGGKGKVENKNRYDIAYRKPGGVFIMKIDSNKEYCIAKAGYPFLSPDGQKLILNKSTKINDSDKIYQVIIDLNTMKELKLNIKNKFYASSEAWSPDNNFLAFIFCYPDKNYLCQIGVIKSDNTGFRILDFSSENLNSLSWSGDGKYIITSDGVNIFKIGVKQFYSDTINFFKTIYHQGRLCVPSFSGEAKYLLTQDNRYLIFNALSAIDSTKKVIPSYSLIYTYDFILKKVTSLTPYEIYASEPCLGLDNDIYFTGYTDKKNNIYAIYKVNIITKKLTKIIDNAKNPSCRILK